MARQKQTNNKKTSKQTKKKFDPPLPDIVKAKVGPGICQQQRIKYQNIAKEWKCRKIPISITASNNLKKMIPFLMFLICSIGHFR